jgi:hypothetical protein
MLLIVLTLGNGFLLVHNLIPEFWGFNIGTVMFCVYYLRGPISLLGGIVALALARYVFTGKRQYALEVLFAMALVAFAAATTEFEPKQRVTAPPSAQIRPAWGARQDSNREPPLG